MMPRLSGREKAESGVFLTGPTAVAFTGDIDLEAYA